MNMYILKHFPSFVQKLVHLKFTVLFSSHSTDLLNDLMFCFCCCFHCYWNIHCIHRQIISKLEKKITPEKNMLFWRRMRYVQTWIQRSLSHMVHAAVVKRLQLETVDPLGTRPVLPPADKPDQLHWGQSAIRHNGPAVIHCWRDL